MPQCVICVETNPNPTMKPSLLKWHLDSNHVEKNNEDPYFSAPIDVESKSWNRLIESFRSHVVCSVVKRKFMVHEWNKLSNILC